MMALRRSWSLWWTESSLHLWWCFVPPAPLQARRLCSMLSGRHGKQRSGQSKSGRRRNLRSLFCRDVGQPCGTRASISEGLLGISELLPSNILSCSLLYLLLRISIAKHWHKAERDLKWMKKVQSSLTMVFKAEHWVCKPWL